MLIPPAAVSNWLSPSQRLFATNYRVCSVCVVVNIAIPGNKVSLEHFHCWNYQQKAVIELLGVGEFNPPICSIKPPPTFSPKSRLDGLLRLLQFCNLSVLLWMELHICVTYKYYAVLCIVCRWRSLINLASFLSQQLAQIDLSVLTCR